ncbi:hypothetical protein HAX54_020818 [Datura stramonium]|uniref:Uncharacterized protein n=1 Tax=Datura stramonium TaxID=4076 RepID=A0ABS8S3L2_DATST|nr:hypothetical protein [Datura stramonium]
MLPKTFDSRWKGHYRPPVQGGRDSIHTTILLCGQVPNHVLVRNSLLCQPTCVGEALGWISAFWAVIFGLLNGVTNEGLIETLGGAIFAYVGGLATCNPILHLDILADSFHFLYNYVSVPNKWEIKNTPPVMKTLSNLPSPFISVKDLIKFFARKGRLVDDTLTISGANSTAAKRVSKSLLIPLLNGK